MNLNLNMIILYVQNVEKLKAFYVDLLKLEVIEEIQGEWLVLKAGSCNIGLHKMGTEYLEKEQTEFQFETNAKLVFEIDEDLTEIRTDLLNKKVFMKEIKTFDNYPYWLCDGKDPEGNVFQLKQKKE